MNCLRLQLLDEVTVLAKDKTWLVEGRVHAADDTSVIFKPRSTSYLPAQSATPAKPTHNSAPVEVQRVM